MSNVQFSKIGKAVMQNKPLSRFIANKLTNLTNEEKKNGYFEISLKNNKKLKVIFSPGKK